MSKKYIKMSLKEMCITKHGVLKSISKKQEKLLESKDQKEIQDLTKDIVDETRFYDKMAKNIADFKKENNIERVLVITITDDIGTHTLQNNSFIVKCNKCEKERPLLESDMNGKDFKIAKCECGGENEFRYWLDKIYSEEEYEELKRKAGKRYKFEGYHKGEGESNE